MVLPNPSNKMTRHRSKPVNLLPLLLFERGDPAHFEFCKIRFVNRVTYSVLIMSRLHTVIISSITYWSSFTWTQTER